MFSVSGKLYNEGLLYASPTHKYEDFPTTERIFM
jgi:hypothetical protein